MRTKIVTILSLICFFYIQIDAQDCTSIFTSALQMQLQNLKKNEMSSIGKFMRVGYKVHPEYKLREKNVISIPVYSLFWNKKIYYQNNKKDIKNILCYIDTKRLFINEVYFYKDSSYYCKAFSAYSNFPDQPIYYNIKHYNEIANIILNANPDIIFQIGQSGAYYFLKGSEIFVYSRSYNKEKIYVKYKLEEFVNNYLDELDLIFGTDYSPSIYCK